MQKTLLASLLQMSLLAGGLALATAPLYAADTPAKGRIPPVSPHLEATKAYPSQEVREIASDAVMPEGRAIVKFHVRNDGGFEKVELLQTSGVPALDRQTIKSVEAARCAECAGHDYTVAYLYKAE